MKIFLLPGGILPKRHTVGAVGFDFHARAVVSSMEIDPQIPCARKTLFDFHTLPDDEAVRRKVVENRNKLCYCLSPGESVLIATGFIVEMEFPWAYDLQSRNGLASRDGIVVVNNTVPVDSDFRGEASARVFNWGQEPCHIFGGMRIGQILFRKMEIPEFELVENYSMLSQTGRGAKSFGSTGL